MKGTFISWFVHIALIIIVVMSGYRADAQKLPPLQSGEQQELKGDIYTIALFVDSELERWSEGEKDYYFQELVASQEWLSNEASRYNTSVRWHNDQFAFNKETIYLSDYHLFSPRLMLEGTLQVINKESVSEILEEQSGKVRADRVKLLYFVKSRDRSIAVNYWSKKKIDVAIISCRSTYGMMTDHYTISHELLHQFGAWDLYYGKSHSLENAEKIKMLYPNSLMINTHVNKDKLEVDQLTASLIGWQEPDQARLDEFRPVFKIRQKGGSSEYSLEPSGKD